ncbi:MAG: cyclic nucleotide-binding domain-containing protein [Desulfobulbaceae bacterium]|nr:cyclic nucleotide-binding domain-containing protein [Desulfobulbaceae bacterium]
MSDSGTFEQQIGQCIADGRKEEAVELLYRAILSCAKQRNFLEADRLHARLIEVNPMALNEIINSAEAIDAAKIQAIDTNHREIHARLYEIFSSNEERNAFYYAMKQISVEAGSEILCQGRLNSRLFLVNRGILKVMIRKGDHETFLKSVGAGEVVGADTFFPISICTASVVAENAVKLSVLERKDLAVIEQDNVGMEAKLEAYCLQNEKEKVADILRKKSLERRNFKRYKVEGKVRVQIVDGEQKPVGSAFGGLIEDISAGGLLFGIKCSQKVTARAILGRRGLFQVIFNQDGQRLEVTKPALITGVVYNLFNDYSVHARFEKNLNAEELKKVLVFARAS